MKAVLEKAYSLGFVEENYDNLQDDDEFDDVAVTRDFRLAVIHEPRRHNRRRAKR